MAELKPKFTRVLHRGDIGIDVEAVSRAYIKVKLWDLPFKKFMELPAERRRLFDSNRELTQMKLENQMNAKQDGVYARTSFEELVRRDAFGATAIKQLNDWAPPPPPLIEPKQGFDSLHPSLHWLYAACIRLGGFDLGTYNPASKLPSGKMSDHASSKDYATAPSRPAMAFDIGIDPDSGYDNPKGRAMFVLCMAHPKECEYVILGTKIGFPENGKVEVYTAGGHMNHLHCSGHRRS